MILRSGGAAVELLGYDNEHEFIHEYVPMAKLSGEMTSIDAILNVHPGGRFSLELDYPQATICSDNDYEIIAFADYLLERARQERGTYCIHSAAAAKKGRGVVFFGSMPDLGKTCLAMEAAEAGFDFISDEKTLLSGKDIVGGVQYINLRKPWQTGYGSGLIQASEIFTLTERAELSLFVYPTCHVERWSEEKAFWHLQEELSRKIRGISRYVNNMSLLAPSLDTEQLSAQRIAYAREISRTIPFFHIRGSPEDIIRTIEDLL